MHITSISIHTHLYPYPCHAHANPRRRAVKVGNQASMLGAKAELQEPRPPSQHKLPTVPREAGTYRGQASMLGAKAELQEPRPPSQHKLHLQHYSILETQPTIPLLPRDRAHG